MRKRPGTRSRWPRRSVLLITGAACAVVALILVTGWDVVRHGHPAYAALLAATAIVAAIGATRWRGTPATSTSRRVLRVVGAVLAICWVVGLVWLRPFAPGPTATAAVTATAGPGAVRVQESTTRILLRPNGFQPDTGVFFQPGARVDARAYAAHLRPLAEAGHLVVIVKQPLGIAFLAIGEFDRTRDAHPEITRWVVAGHSLGGTVAAMEVERDDPGQAAPVAGLMLWASYPAGNLSDLSARTHVCSISGSRDGLSTPAKIEASRATLPGSTTFTEIEGASHDQFGDYGTQPGAGSPTISAAQAREDILAATLACVGQGAG